MTDHCSPYCPFLACDGCAYQGGKSVATQGNLVESGNSKTAPAGNRGLTTTTEKES